MSDRDLVHALASLEPVLLEADYALVGYERGTAPPSPAALAAEPFAVRIDDPYETTFVLPEGLADELRPPPAIRQDGLRAVCLAAQLPPTLTGFMSTIAGALADRGIAIVPLGAATRDHLLVPTARWPEVLAVLRGLRDAARQVLGAADDPA